METLMFALLVVGIAALYFLPIIIASVRHYGAHGCYRVDRFPIRLDGSRLVRCSDLGLR